VDRATGVVDLECISLDKLYHCILKASLVYWWPRSNQPLCRKKPPAI